jgi:hypothetical protein
MIHPVVSFSALKWISSFGFLAPKDLKIIWLSNMLALSVPDDVFPEMHRAH